MPGYKIAKVTTEIGEMAKMILKRNNPIGTVTPFVINEREYVARDEIHDYQPRGPHHGISIYIKSQSNTLDSITKTG